MADTDLREPDAPAAPPRPSWETAPRPSPRPSLPAHSSRAATPPRPAPPAAVRTQPAPPTAPAFSAPPLPDTTGLRYDLAGNPIASSGPGPSPYAPPAPFSYSPGSYSPGLHSPGPASGASVPGTWPPAPTRGPLTKSNNSGELDTVPPEIARKIWNWGAFFFPILWLKKHNMTTLAGMISMSIAVPRMIHAYAPFLPYVNLIALAGLLFYWVVRVFFGVTGHKFAWRNRHFQDGVPEYFKVQQAWMLWGFGLFALDIAVQIFVVGPLIMGGSSPRPLSGVTGVGSSGAGGSEDADESAPDDASGKAAP